MFSFAWELLLLICSDQSLKIFVLSVLVFAKQLFKVLKIHKILNFSHADLTLMNYYDFFKKRMSLFLKLLKNSNQTKTLVFILKCELYCEQSEKFRVSYFVLIRKFCRSNLKLPQLLIIFTLLKDQMYFLFDGFCLNISINHLRLPTRKFIVKVSILPKFLTSFCLVRTFN